MFNPQGITGLIMFALQMVALAAAVFAVFHAARQRKDAFTAVDKLTKPIWLGVLVASLVVIFLFGLNLLGLIAIIAVCVYLVDVRPRVDDIQRGPRW
ncbi:DUF2516 family protein [Rhodococcus xishaensis]|nr:DUF2516 family protein [Rhodococcus xishaensis]